MGDGQQAANNERRRAARDRDLPIDAQWRVHDPDAQLEYADEDGRIGRINVEVASGHYSVSAIRTKANAGFVVNVTGPFQPECFGHWAPATTRLPSLARPSGTRPGFRAVGYGDATLENQCRSDGHPGRLNRPHWGSRLEYLMPFWRLILADYGLAIGLHLGLVLGSVAAGLYGVAHHRLCRPRTADRSGGALGSTWRRRSGACWHPPAGYRA